MRRPARTEWSGEVAGVAPQLGNLDVTLTVEQNLLVFSYLYRIGRAERHEAVERAPEMAKLTDRRDSRVDKLSASPPASCSGYSSCAGSAGGFSGSVRAFVEGEEETAEVVERLPAELTGPGVFDLADGLSDHVDRGSAAWRECDALGA